MVPLLALLGFSLAPSFSQDTAPQESVSRKLDYDYVELDYAYVDLDGVPGHQSGIAMLGSYQFFNNFFLEGTVIAGRGDVDLDTYKIGAGYHFGLTSQLDLVGQLSYVHEHFHQVLSDLDGYQLDLGVRYLLTEQWELNGFVEFRHLHNDDDVGVQIGGRYYLTGPFSLGANIETIDNDNTFTAGVRFQF
jgi:hypothetical protein